MKKTLHIFSFVSLLAGFMIFISSCHLEKKPDSLVLAASDTTGLAEFQSLKAMNEVKEASKYYVEGYKDAMASNNAQKPKVVYKTSKPAVQATAPTQPAEKKGWSKAAKGTVIGTSAGALAGALINKKNRLVGGIIGGIVGGGIGYGVGRGMDKKDGRVK